MYESCIRCCKTTTAVHKITMSSVAVTGLLCMTHGTRPVMSHGQSESYQLHNFKHRETAFCQYLVNMRLILVSNDAENLNARKNKKENRNSPLPLGCSQLCCASTPSPRASDQSAHTVNPSLIPLDTIPVPGSTL